MKNKQLKILFIVIHIFSNAKIRLFNACLLSTILSFLFFFLFIFYFLLFFFHLFPLKKILYEKLSDKTYITFPTSVVKSTRYKNPCWNLILRMERNILSDSHPIIFKTRREEAVKNHLTETCFKSLKVKKVIQSRYTRVFEMKTIFEVHNFLAFCVNIVYNCDCDCELWPLLIKVLIYL